MHRGYVKFWRKTIDSRVFKDPNLLKVWIWCLSKASHKGQWVQMETGKGIVEVWIEPGQFVFGRESAAKILDMKSSSVRNRMNKLKTLKNIDINADRQFSIVSVLNWDTYQPASENVDSEEDSNVDRQRTAKGQPKDTYKNVKNVENICITPLPPKNENGNHAKALKLYNAYLDLCDPTPDHRSRARCVKNLVYYLDHFSFDDLMASIKGYSEAKSESDRIFIKDPANFFGKKDPVFSDYLSTASKGDDGWQLN